MNCPNCQSSEIVKNGSLTNGKPKYRCKGCGCQFVENPQKPPISAETRALIDKGYRNLANVTTILGVGFK